MFIDHLILNDVFNKDANRCFSKFHTFCFMTISCFHLWHLTSSKNNSFSLSKFLNIGGCVCIIDSFLHQPHQYHHIFSKRDFLSFHLWFFSPFFIQQHFYCLYSFFILYFIINSNHPLKYYPLYDVSDFKYFQCQAV